MKQILLLLAICNVLAAGAQQKTTDPLKQKALVLKRFLEKNHYKPLHWSDTSSAMLYEKWLQELDEEKLFFTAADLLLLNVYKTTLDDELNGGEWKFFASSMDIYRNRLQKADSICNAILAKPIDFLQPDNIEWPFKNYAASDAELAQRWQRYIRWQMLSNIADDMNENNEPLKEQQPADFKSIESKVRAEVKKHESVYISNLLSTPADFKAGMEDAYLNAIAWCYDPHSSYMNLSEKKEFHTEMSASEYTAGFDIEENEKGNKSIGYLQPGGSAWRSGQLHKGDELLRIKMNGIEKSADLLSAEEIESMLSGNNEAGVEVTVRTAAGEIKTVKLSKEKVADDEGIVKSYVLRNTKNIGYINLPGFYSREEEGPDADVSLDGCANDVSKEIVKLKKDSISGLILDLRYNGGGGMWEGMQLAGIFIDIGPVASVKEKDGTTRFLKDPNRGSIYDGPLLVLTNGLSASASEFVAAALQDYNRAIIVGGTTYGKGTAQIVLPMDTLPVVQGKQYADYVKVTARKFYRINGSTTQWEGVVPDITYPDIYSNKAFKEKANASALQPDLTKKGFYQQAPALPTATLKSNSIQRIAASAYFKAMENYTKVVEKNTTGRMIPLQWSAYVQHYKKAKETFKLLEENSAVSLTSLTVRNNSFDHERIRQSTERQKEINDVYLKQVQSDPEIEEACRIMMDWTQKK